MGMISMNKNFPERNQDHGASIESALEQAEALCRERGARLTPLRRRVLEIIQESHAPLGAYDVLQRMNADGERNAPPTVYRALDFLLKHGLIHRIESQKAFVGCAMAADAHDALFLICRDCGSVAETHSQEIGEAIEASATRAGFLVEMPVMEISGRCQECHDDE